MRRGDGGEEDVLYADLSYRVVAAAIAVWKTLGYGFLERVYQQALLIELREAGIHAAAEVPIEVAYRGQVVGHYAADVIADEKIILELKAGKAIAGEHVAQALNYLAATGLRLALILNFGPDKMEFKRVIR